MTNLQKFQTGTSPTNSASLFGIIDIANLKNDLRVTWQAGTGKTNALERTAGAATNSPSFYYRVRLVP